MTERENKLRAIRFEKPEYIPVRFVISEAVFSHYDPAAVEDLLLSHPVIAGEKALRPELSDAKDGLYDYDDEFGVQWEGAIAGIRGAVKVHPLADFSRIPAYTFPPLPKFDPEADRMRVESAKARGEFTEAGLPHGHTFLRITDLCGYENTLYGMMDEDENLIRLIKRLEDYNYAFTSHYAKCGYDMVGYGEDLGMQSGPMLSPKLFKKYIQPSYRRIMKPARDAGAIIHMHSDGDIRALYEYLLEGGVDVLNLQDLVNGVDWIREHFFGKYCVELDIDRQNVTGFGTPKDGDELVKNEVRTLSSPAGGLMLIYGWYPGTPIENIRALMDAIEKYMFMW